MDYPDYSYTRLSSRAVSQIVESLFPVSGNIETNFYIAGLHDNYLVTAGVTKYIFRLYRNAWRTPAEIAFETDLISHLNQKRSPVMHLVTSKAKAHFIEIDSQDGIRYGALFEFAEGYAPAKDLNAEEGFLLGKAVARFHNDSDSFKRAHRPKQLNLSCLLDDAITSISRFIDEQDCLYVASLKPDIYQALEKREYQKGDFGICSGDINPMNFHIGPQETVTLFDFDQCGFGYRSFEIAKFFSSLYKNRNATEIRSSFLKGYHSLRRFDERDISLIPYFEIVAVIWVMSINAQNAEYIGYKHLESDFWDRRLVILRELALALA